MHKVTFVILSALYFMLLCCCCCFVVVIFAFKLFPFAEEINVSPENEEMEQSSLDGTVNEPKSSLIGPQL